MELKDDALPIHEDAELKIRPRIFLEGNFFVELDPGTGSEPELDDGDTVPAAQTSGTVQLDEVLTSLQSDTRADLQKLLQGYGDALNGEPQPGEDDDQEPMTQGRDGGGVAQRLARHRAGRAARHRDRERRGARDRAARPLEAGHRPEPRVRGARREGGAAQGLHHELQPHHGGVRGRGGQPARDDPAAARGARAGQPGARQPERGVPADARVRARDPAGRPRDARPRSRRRSRGSSRCARWSRRPSSRAS